MCVDYAYKNRVRAGKGWALRVVKLRLSRKLIFAAGLLACLQCDPKLLTGEREHLKGSQNVNDQSDFLLRFVEQSPLDIVADGLARYAQDGTTVRVLNAYDQFLTKVHDTNIRETLENLQPKEEENHPVLLDLKAIGKEFQQGIVDLFFTDHPDLAQLTRQFGLF